jgi:hypothetical protein
MAYFDPVKLLGIDVERSKKVGQETEFHLRLRSFVAAEEEWIGSFRQAESHHSWDASHRARVEPLEDAPRAQHGEVAEIVVVSTSDRFVAQRLEEIKRNIEFANQQVRRFTEGRQADEERDRAEHQAFRDAMANLNRELGFGE